jgi:CRISPR system Cascade subunit CasC
MLQSMPPGNPNRDENGQPKKCIFGRVTRARISSQCLKRNIREYLRSVSGEARWKDVFEKGLADRTQWLPRMVGDQLSKVTPDITEDELSGIKAVLAKQFRKEEKRAEPEDGDEADKEASAPKEPAASGPDQTGQLVFFPPPFAKEVAILIANFRKQERDAYREWVGMTPDQPKLTKDQRKKLSKGEEKELKGEEKKIKDQIKNFEHEVKELSNSLTVDIALFGRMTTSDLVVNVEAACQVAHAISTHEAIIERDWLTAMDDKKAEFAPTQTKEIGAAYIGSESFFDSAVYYKYLNLDLDEIKKHLSWTDERAAHAAGVFLEAAVRANPTGKQNAFANHGAHELILVEVSEKKWPISYANAFLKAVEGENLMTESAKALSAYIGSVAKAFSPSDTRRALLAVGSAALEIDGAKRADTLDALVDWVAVPVRGRGAAA